MEDRQSATAALVLFREVEQSDPNTYAQILFEIQPHSVEAIARILQYHLNKSVKDLFLFNHHRKAIPRFLLRFVQVVRKSFPTPGDAFGIHITCRLTKNDTQETLDSKHLRSAAAADATDPDVDCSSASASFNVEKELAYELQIFSTQNQVFELATRRKYSTVFVRGLSIQELIRRLQSCVVLERGGPLNKGRCYLDGVGGSFKYLSAFKYILVDDPRGYVKIVYESFKDLDNLLRRVPFNHVLALSDIRFVLKSGGIAAYFLNLLLLIRLQACVEPDSVHERDVCTVIKYQCRTGTPLPLNRDGLAKHPDRSPLEVLCFEAPKKNLVRYCCKTLQVPRERDEGVYPVHTSMDKIFFGEQFGEGTGGSTFAIMQNPT